ncbi:RagB/SusD family nutrient uptake outer membrane protein [Flavobacterium hibisci]|uniref:RagB/SusD family nutrient uptake outer membrane protein n=1 Tax=Flavobacterium hibisci TaxID=1914462 RepID=UPI001CBBBC95|nr:RagB/SusD family nutrient uptake outer membrane protein [Flavobacterium hibisci]MBZ4044592.1 RagB/SusD family nutrient uptake outer membrane protein [Flavobacterium hibisci]
MTRKFLKKTVLLSYLESKLEAGEAIDQSLLDETINKIRARADVNMPAITTTNPTELREKIRVEREVEFAFEGLHYYDILRWGIAAEKLNRQFTGMKLTNDPANYTAFKVDEEGYLIYQKRNFAKGVNELWPIPQAERNVNTKLTQNTGYPN